MSELEQKIHEIFSKRTIYWNVVVCSYEELSYVLKLIPHPDWIGGTMYAKTEYHIIDKLKDLYVKTQLQELINE